MLYKNNNLSTFAIILKNNKMNKVLILFILISFKTNTLFGYDVNYSFTPFSINQGLSQSTVQSILMDHKGTLWIGTQDGLNCFNGQNHNTFFHNPDNKLSLPDNNITLTAEDSMGTIWIASNNGLATYNILKREFILKRKEKFYSSMCIEGGILFGGEDVIYHYTYKTQSFTALPIKEKYFNRYGRQENRISKIVPFGENKALVGTREKGIYIYDYKTQQLKSFSADKHHILQAICVASDNCIYISSHGNGLYCYDKNGKLVAHYTTRNSDLKNDYILDIVEEKGALWLATDGGGINLFDLKQKKFSQIRHIPGDISSLPVNSITLIYKDRDNNLWAGSVRGGVISIRQTYIRTFKDVALNNTNGLSEKSVISLFEENNGNLWLGTDGGGINLYRPEINKFIHYPSTYGDKVVSIAPISNNELMVSLYTKGIFIFNKQTGTYRPFTIVNDSINFRECFYGYLPFAHQVADDKIYILSHNAWVYRPSDSKFSKLRINEKQNITTQALVLTYSDDSISLLKRENQAFCVTQRNDSISRLFNLEVGETITALYYDKKGIIWTGSNKGLGYYDLKSKTFHRIPTKLFNGISNLLYEPNDRLWICAQNRLFSYIIKDNKFVIWNGSDGYSSNEIMFSYQKTHLNKKYIYLCGVEGLVQIKTDIPERNDPIPEIWIDDIIYNGSSYIDKVNEKKVVIPWNYNTLSLQVRIKNKDIFQQSLLHYTITGDIKREFESYSQILELTGLSAGNYTIHVSCITKDGDFTNPVHLINLHISPPWYRSNWFIILFSLFILSIILGILRFLSLKKDKKMKEQMKEYRQFINEEKINFLININHELRTPLTLIYAPLKRLVNKRNDDFDSDYIVTQLNTIFKQAKRMKEIINMVLDLNKLEAGLDEMKLQKHILNKWITELSEDFKSEAKEKNIRICLQLDNQIDYVSFDEWKCQIILSNLLMNALKFSGNDSTITITTLLCEDKVRISITDEGIGLQHTEISKLFTRFYEGNHLKSGSGIGLSYAKMLVEMHGGSMGAFNNADKGATFFFELPMSKSEFNEKDETERMNANYSDLPLISEKRMFDFKKMTLLIVDDDDELRNYLVESFTGIFMQVYSESCAEDALATCRSQLPNMVISDVMMPGMSGYELCVEIKKDSSISHIPLILLTARCDQESVKMGYKLGADFYISKPFDIDYLQMIINNIFLNREKIHAHYTTSGAILSPKELTTSKGDEDFMVQLNNLISDNLSEENFTIHFIAEAMAMSRSSLYNKLKLITGLGVNDYINRLRIEKAASLLISTKLNINEISSEVGFIYPRYFSSIFKQMKGVTPKQYRENNT